MGHYVNRTSEMFEDLSYAIKTTEELREAFSAKIVQVRERVEERQGRIVKLREENQLSAERLAQLVSLFQQDADAYLTNYDHQGQGDGERIIPAGVIANIVREYSMIENEKKQVRRMELVSRNLRDTEPFYNPRTGEHGVRPCIHELTDHELEYLGF